MATGNGNLARVSRKKPPKSVGVLEFPNRERKVEGEGPYLVVYGTVGEGFLFTGIFKTVSAAIDFAEMYLSAYNWEVATLQDPEEVKRG